MGRLISDGLIRGWGLSQVSAATLQAANAVTGVTVVQNIYSMTERNCEQDIFPFCLEHNIGVAAFSPTASGLLSGKVTTETKFEGDDVRKFVPQLSKENLTANQPLLDMLAAFLYQGSKADVPQKRKNSSRLNEDWNFCISMQLNS